ncbi:hypothetical protein ACQSSU_20270 [Micromonospora echinospora]
MSQTDAAITTISGYLAELGCAADTAEQIAATTVRDYIAGVGRTPDPMADLTPEARGVTGQIMITFAVLSRDAGTPNPDLGVAADHAAHAVRTALTTVRPPARTPDWGPLESTVTVADIGNWMWMGRLTRGSRVIEQYKHWETRRYVNLDQDGNAWRVRYTEDSDTPDVDPIPVADALAWARP